MTTTTHEPSQTQAQQPLLIPRDVPCDHPVGPLDKDSIHSILERLPQLPAWPENRRANRYLDGARQLLEWLAEHDGEGWQARWAAADGDTYTWIEGLSERDRYRRSVTVGGLRFLLLARVFRPGYEFFRRFWPHALYDQAQKVLEPDLFKRLDQIGVELGLPTYQLNEGKKVCVKLALHTGKNVSDLVEQDVLELRAFNRAHDRKTSTVGVVAAWDLLRAAGVLLAPGSLRDVLRRGQRPTEELVDAYGLRCKPIRNLLVRYLDERRASLDYSTLRGLAHVLAKLFWRNLEEHHPGIGRAGVTVDSSEHRESSE